MTVGQRRIIAVIHFPIHFLLNIRTMLQNRQSEKKCVFGVLIRKIMKTLLKEMNTQLTKIYA